MPIGREPLQPVKRNDRRLLFEQPLTFAARKS